jgi:hypothetical protein
MLPEAFEPELLLWTRVVVRSPNAAAYIKPVVVGTDMAT